MVLNISDILRESGASKEFEGEQLLKNIEYQGEQIIFPSPLKIQGTVSNTGRMLLLKLNAKGYIDLQCSVCVETYRDLLDLSFEATYQSAREPAEPDTFLYQNYRIDLEDAVLENILLDLPIRKICRQDCKGICPYCGINLNITKCRCDYEIRHPEF